MADGVASPYGPRDPISGVITEKVHDATKTPRTAVVSGRSV